METVVTSEVAVDPWLEVEPVDFDITMAGAVPWAAIMAARALLGRRRAATLHGVTADQMNRVEVR